MRSFNDAIKQLLWPEQRAKDIDQKASFPDGVYLLGGTGPAGTGPSLVDRTTQRTYLRVATGYLPAPLSGATATKVEHAIAPWLFSDTGIQIGPIPAGTPVNLLADLNFLSDSTNRLQRIMHNTEVLFFLLKLKHDLQSVPNNATDDQVRQVFSNAESELIKFNKCPDFVVNRGHYFGTDLLAGEPGLSDADKNALVEFVKTF
jgi:hypothetical protein